MADLSPLKNVYEFFQSGQTSATVTRRRYPAGGSTVGLSGLKARGPYVERPLAVFKVPQSVGAARRGDVRKLDERGASSSSQRIVYSTSSFFTTNANTDSPADVVFTTDGRAWTVISVNDWDEALGFEVTIEWSEFVKGEAPFDA